MNTIEVRLYLYDYGNGKYVKMLIDEDNILYHYIDHVAIGFLNKNGVEFYYETPQEYEEMRKKKDYLLKRFSDL